MSKVAHSSIGIVNVDDGAKGEQGYSVTGTFPEYYLSSSSTALVDGTWSETKPTATENKYIWTRLKTVLSNGTIKYSNFTCDTTLSGVISKVNQAEQKITNKVWQTDISASIDSYDNSKGKSIRDRVSKVETDLTGITSTVSDVKTTLNSKANTSDVNTHVTNLTSKIQQNADKIGLMVSVDGTSSSLTLTDKMLEAVTEQFVVKSPNGVSTVIEGGKIKTDALKSTNYQSGSTYSQQGSFFDLSNGNITTPEFAVSSGQASFKGTLNATKGTIGRWKIGTDTLTATDGKNQVGLGDSSRAFWAGSATSTSAPFQVLYDGTVVATKLKIGDTAVADYVNNAAKDNAAKAQKTADDASTIANAANDLATKTSKYITTISGIDGITVHNADDLKNFTNMNSDGVSIYVDSNPVAKFGKDGIDLLSDDNSKLSITKSGIKAVTSSQTDYFNITLNQSSDKKIINEILPFDCYVENSTYVANFNLKYQLDNINSTQGVKIVGMTQDQDNLISATIQTTNQAISLDSATAKSFSDKKVSMVRISYVAYNPTANMTLGAKQTNGKYTFEIDSLGNIRTIGGIRVGWDGNNDITAVGNSDGLFALSVGIDNTAMRVGWDGTVYTDVINAGLSSGNLQIVTTGTEGHVDIDGRLYVSKDVVARTDSYNSVGLLDLSGSTLTLSSLKKPAIYNERLASVIGGYKQVGRIVFVHLVIHMDEAGFTSSAVLTGLPIPASKNWGNADTPLTAMNISKKSPCYLFVNRYGSIVLTADPSNWIIVHGFYMAEQA